MEPASAKAKGRRLQNEIREILLEHFGDRLERDDIKTAVMGESGEDIKRSPLAKRLLPFSFECKNQEKLNIWSAIQQSEDNCPDGDIPIVAFRRNRSDIFVALSFENFLRILNG